MKEQLLHIKSPPFTLARFTVQRLMLLVIAALVPAIGAGYVFFGTPALMHIFLTTLTAMLCEGILQWLLRKPITVLDFSAAVTGLLLGVNLPPAAPYWIGPVGAVVAIVIVKQTFGGLGCNFVNPALTARALLLASWPSEMVSFVRPYDAVTTATPLSLIAGSDPFSNTPTMFQLFIGEVAGTIGETSALALLLGGLLLVFLNVIDVRIPLGILGTVFVISSLFSGPEFTFGFNLSFGLYQLLSGGVILGAFFMATDYVTSPVTLKGRWVYAIAIGVITVLIRFWGRYPEGISFAILIMNIAVPLIERFTMPRGFGEVNVK